jgi:hypothetical protein
MTVYLIGINDAPQLVVFRKEDIPEGRRIVREKAEKQYAEQLRQRGGKFEDIFHMWDREIQTYGSVAGGEK